MNASLKVILFSFCLFTFVTFVHGNGQGKEDTFAKVVSTGVVVKLKPYFSDRLQIFIGSSGRIYSAQQAAVILEDFFSKDQPRVFKQLLKGGSESRMYIIGTLYTENSTYCLSIYFLQEEGKREVVQQIRIDKHDD